VCSFVHGNSFVEKLAFRNHRSYSFKREINNKFTQQIENSSKSSYNLSNPGFPKSFVTHGLLFGSMKPTETTQATFDHSLRENPMGEARKDALRLNFDHTLKLAQF
jgi:hypothetical protein